MKKECDFKNKILGAIQEKHIEPIPRWKFLVREYGIWVAAGLALLAGGVSGGVALFAIANSDMSVVTESGFSHVVGIAVGIWLIAFAAMIGIAAFNAHKTRRGYRYPLFALVGILIAFSFGVSGVLFASGYGKSFDEAIARHVSMYRGIEQGRMDFWRAPEQGRLLGEVVAFTNDGRSMLVIDDELEEWTVHLPHRLPILRRAEILDKGNPVVVTIGHQIGEKEFKACIIKPWRLHGSRPMWHNRPKFNDAERKLFAQRIEKCEREMQRKRR